MTAAPSPLEARLSLPPARPASVPLDRVLARIDAAPGGSLITVVAPAGSGKTTLLAHWSGRLPTWTYLRLDPADTDPARLLDGIAAALARVQPLPESLTRHLGRPSVAIEAALLPAMVQAFWTDAEPLVLLLDEVQVLDGTPALEALAWLVRHLPERIRMVLSSRTVPALPIRRLALDGRVLELRSADLALSGSAIAAMAERLGRPLTHEDAQRVASVTDGWAAAAVVALGLPDPTSLSGGATAMAAYLREQVLDPLDPADRDWLCRASVLDVLTGPFCDEVLGVPGSLRRLRDLEEHDTFVLAADARRTAFRLHSLVRDVLRDELDMEDPDAAGRIRRRAAQAAEAAGDAETAAEYAIASGDPEMLAAIVERHAVPLYWRGRLATVARWIAPFDTDALRGRHAAVALLGAWFEALEGRTEAAIRWLTIAEHSPDTRPMPDGTPSKLPWIAALRALMMPRGLVQARADAHLADAGLAQDSYFRQHADIALALVAFADGDLEGAQHQATAASATAAARSARPGQVAALGIAAAAAMELGDVAAARRTVEQGLGRIRETGLDHYSVSAPVFATAARCRSSLGDREGARQLLVRFDRSRPLLGDAFPVFTLITLIQAMRARLQCHDLVGTRVLLAEARHVLHGRSDIGWPATAIHAIEQAVDSARFGRNGEWGLTAAELRVLSLLPTHLSLRELAERIHISPHTIKTQTVALYAKLGATSRREAIEIAVAAGLLDASVLYRPAALLDGEDAGEDATPDPR